MTNPNYKPDTGIRQRDFLDKSNEVLYERAMVELSMMREYAISNMLVNKGVLKKLRKMLDYDRAVDLIEYSYLCARIIDSEVGMEAVKNSPSSKRWKEYVDGLPKEQVWIGGKK
jgi:hypothetical protein